MQLPKLTPLQSRLLASAIATCLLIVIWIVFQPQNFVYAAELPIAFEDSQHSQRGQSIPPESHSLGLGIEGEERGKESVGYQGDFAYFDNSLIGRQEEDVVKLENGQMRRGEVRAEEMRFFRFERGSFGGKRRGVDADLGEAFERLVEDVEVEKGGGENVSERGVDGDIEASEEEGDSGFQRRQGGSQVFLSVTSCRLPTPNDDVRNRNEDPPQLTLYVSTSSDNQRPGPGSMDPLATQPIQFQDGYANLTFQTLSDVYIGVSAPSLAEGWEGGFNFEVAASTDGYYHSYIDQDPFTFLVDTDSESALFITHNLTENNDTAVVNKWTELKNDSIPFEFYAYSEKTWGARGLARSSCGIQQSLNTSNITVERSVTSEYRAYGPKLPKVQFHVQNLEKGTTYFGFLAMNGTMPIDGLDKSNNITVQGGGRVWKQFQWTTKADDSCQVIFNLPFCKSIAYAVPSSPQFKRNTTGLGLLYDTQAAAHYKNFTKSLAQIACETTGTAQYSLARNCTDCANDYKAWLCAVLMPRCEDFSATGDWLQERNINARFPVPEGDEGGDIAHKENMTKEFNETHRDRFAFSKSRNPMIDDIIKPGPYKEVKPCEDLCFGIVRSCPALLGFACPNEPARSLTYWRTDPKFPGNLTCSFPGAVINLNMFRGDGARVRVGRVGMAVLVAVVVAVGTWI